MTYTLVYNAEQLVTGPAGQPDEPAVTTDAAVDTASDAAVDTASDAAVDTASDAAVDTASDAAVVIDGDTVTAVGPTDAITRAYPAENARTAIDASGSCVLPGFVDCHTHALFVGDRSDEFEAKLRGKSYQDILAEGGGILRTVRQVRNATDDDLYERLVDHLDLMLAHGTTTVEVKSGYGLDTETELRMLEIIDRADQDHAVDVVPTFMGAHAVPDDTDSETYTSQVIDEQLPAVEQQGIAEFCDVFCEEDVFSVEQSRRILDAGKSHGLTPKIHADEFVRLGGSQLAADVSAASADHLLQASVEDVDALVEGGVTPVFLPGTAFGLGGDYPAIEPYRERGTIPAIASDFNPNCHAPSMGFAATLACVGVGMTPGEAILGITSRGADALDRQNGLGTVQEGAPGDLVVLDAPAYRHLPYTYDVNIVETVIKGGTAIRP